MLTDVVSPFLKLYRFIRQVQTLNSICLNPLNRFEGTFSNQIRIPTESNASVK